MVNAEGILNRDPRRTPEPGLIAPSGSRYLFLDFDGVLNSASAFARLKGTYAAGKCIDPEAVKRLDRIVEATNCAIVVSSAWRQLYDNYDLYRTLRHYGSEWACLNLYSQTGSYGDRPFEVRQWLHTEADGIGYVILDDTDFDWDKDQRSHLVLTTWELGLLDEHVDKAIDILMKGGME